MVCIGFFASGGFNSFLTNFPNLEVDHSCKPVASFSRSNDGRCVYSKGLDGVICSFTQTKNKKQFKNHLSTKSFSHQSIHIFEKHSISNKKISCLAHLTIPNLHPFALSTGLTPACKAGSSHISSNSKIPGWPLKNGLKIPNQRASKNWVSK